MNFNSGTFAIFMLIVGLGYVITQLCCRRHWPQNLMLLTASYWFYGSWDRQLLFLILISTACDYVCGLAIRGRKPSPRSTLAMFAGLLGAATILCAPIHWPAIFSAATPVFVWEGGWVLKPVYQGFFTHDGDWLHVIAAVAATAVLGGVLSLGYALGDKRGETFGKRYFLWTSMVSNLGLLAFFKYCDFFLEGLTTLVNGLGLGEHAWSLGIIVPVGISFYTFQTMSYTIDIYRGKLEPTTSLLDFSVFVAFFPQLVAGPIERAAALLPQLQRKRPFCYDQWRSGWYLIGWGLFKKIYIADNMIPLVNMAYENSATATGPMVWLSTAAFAVQIYCDFSAYSDIARGVARLMGVELMVNFNLPYFATNPSEFWNRWHISLSTWLRDYLYIPLGGNRGNSAMVYRNLMTTMVLGGLWHGARANFVWWGFYQGALLCIHRMSKPWLDRFTGQSRFAKGVTIALCWLVFMHLMGYGWLLFRASSNRQIIDLTAALFTQWNDLPNHLSVIAKLVFYCWPLVIIQICQYRSRNLLVVMTWPWPVRCGLYFVLFYLTIIFGAFDVVEFIYFQF